MSKEVDERVVGMQFDNKQFEAGVQTSISTIEKLKQSLNFSGAAKGFDSISDSAKRVDFSGLSGAVETVRTKFSALEIMAITALSNITNSAVNAGKRVVSAFTVEPIFTGFQEYETQINAVQTILANTQSRQAEVSRDVLNQIETEASQTAVSVAAANEQALDSLKDSHEKQIKEYKKLAEEEIDVAEDKYENELEALEGAISEENKRLKDAHNEKLALYHEEYLEKLKVIDEERYNQIKQIDDQIDAINALTKAEEEELKAEKQRKKLEELQNAVDDAETSEERKKARERLAEYEDELAREQLLKERERQIEEFENRKNSINEEYDLRVELAEAAYNANVKSENELYEAESANLKAEQSEKKELLRETYEEEKELLKDKHEAELEAIKESQEYEISAMNASHNAALANIESEKNARIKALQESAGMTKGSSLEDVNKALDELNEYADKTIYNFTEMTRNIGTFTAAGVDLDTSVSAIKGIANLAATAGAGSQEASRAMYQLSQALASGTVRLQDWMSIETAHLATQTFQDSLKETARVHGIAIDEMIASEGSFRNSLRHNWLTKDILTETLSKFTGDLTEEELKAIGYTDEQIEKIIELGKTANDAATKVKTFTQLKDTLKEAAQSGWTQSWEIILGDFEEAKAFFTRLSDIFSGMISESAEARNKVLEGWAELGGRDDLIQSLYNTIDAVQSIIKPIKEAFREVFPPITSQNLADFTSKLNDFTAKLILSEESAEKVKMVFKGLFGAIKTLCDAVVKANELLKTGIGFLKEKIALPGLEVLQSLLERITGRMSQVKGTASDMKNGVTSAIEAMGNALAECSFMKVLTAVWNLTKSIGKGIVDIFGKLASGLAGTLGNVEFDSIIDIINMATLGGIASLVKNLAEGLGNVTGILDGVKGCLEAFQNDLKAGTLIKIATAIGVLAASIVAISLIDSSKLTVSLGAITALFVDLMAALGVTNSLSGKAKGATKTISLMIGLSVSLLILAGALGSISTIDSDKLVSSLVSIGVLMAEVLGFMTLLSKNTKKAAKGGASMVLFAASLKILAGVCKDLSSLSWEQMAQGLVGVGALLAEIDVFLNTAKMSGKSMLTATGMVILASALKILASVCADFGNLKWEEIGKGLTGIAGSLAAIAIAAQLMPSNMLGIGTGLLAVSGALVIISDSVIKMGGMEWEEIAKGLVTLGGSMAVLAVGLNAMNGTLSGSAAMLTASISLAALTPTLKSLGSMSWESIAKGLVTLAGAFSVIGIAGAVLAPILPTILGLGGAFALIGVGVLGIGAGLLAASAGLSALAVSITALATAGTAGATAIVASITVIVMGIAGLIPAVIAKFGEGIVAFCDVIANSGSAIGEALGVLVGLLVDVLSQHIPAIVDGLLIFLSSILEALGKHTPEIVDNIFIFVVGLLDGLAQNMPELIQAVADVISSLFRGVLDLLSQMDSKSVAEDILVVGLLAGVMAALSAVSSLVPGAMVGVLGMGAVIGELALVLAAVGALGQIPGIMWLVDEGGGVLEGIGRGIGSFVGGIAGGVMEGISSSFPQIGEDLSAFMTNLKPFIEGASGIDSGVLESVKSLAAIILLLTAADILDGLTSWFTGGVSLKDFGKELAEFGPYLSQYASSVKGINKDVISASSDAALVLAEMAKKLPNQGGIVSWFTGDNRLSVFGKELAEFGPMLKKYGDSVADIDPNIVDASVNAATALSSLAANLPNQGGIISWFTGDNDISTFGEGIEDFGKSLGKYYSHISDIKPELLTSSTSAVEKLIELIKGMADVKVGGVNHFTDALKNLAKSGIKSFTDTFKDSEKDIVKTASEMVSGFTHGINDQKETLIKSVHSLADEAVKSLKDKKELFADSACGIVESFAGGIRDNIELVDTAFVNVVETVIPSIEVKKESFNDTAKVLSNAFINGFRDEGISISTAFVSVVDVVIVKSKEEYSDFYETGKYLVSGFVKGISDSIDNAAKESREMAKKAVEAVEKELKINSPSKVFYALGEFAGEGFTGALYDYGTASYNAGSSVAESAQIGLEQAVASVSDYLENGINAEPTIRPVLDLSDIQNGADNIYGILDGIDGYTVAGSIDAADRIAYSMNMRKTNLGSSDSETLKKINDRLDRIEKTPSMVFNNTFKGIEGNPKEIAYHVSRIMQKEIERKESTWG